VSHKENNNASFDLMDDRKMTSDFKQSATNKRHSHSIVGSPKNLADIDANDISTIGG